MIIAASGGIDSTVLAHEYCQDNDPESLVLVHAVTGTVTSEVCMDNTVALSLQLGCKYYVFDLSLPSIVKDYYVYFDTEKAKLEQKYREHFTGDFDFLKYEGLYLGRYVPGFYTMMWTAIGAIAHTMKEPEVQIGMIKPQTKTRVGPITSDSTAEHLDALNEIGESIWGINPSKLTAPYRDLKKSDVVRKGKKFGVDFEQTLSCDLYPPCEQCYECRIRKAALK